MAEGLLGLKAWPKAWPTCSDPVVEERASPEGAAEQKGSEVTIGTMVKMSKIFIG